MFADRLRVDPDNFRLEDHDPVSTCGWTEDNARVKLAEDIAEMVRLQDRFWAAASHALLIILQARDAAGKDGVIKHVMTGVNPSACRVHAFKAPTSEEQRHDFLWRCVRKLPERGEIGIFNRSYYEEVLVVRVHPQFLAAQGLGDVDPRDRRFWKHRFKDIVHFEEYLRRNNTRILKFFLNISWQEQRKRFLERIESPTKNWKLSPSDYAERRHWNDYQAAYADMLAHTSTAAAPWYVIPADNKWFTRLAVANLIVAALHELAPAYPSVTEANRAELLEVRELLEHENDSLVPRPASKRP